MIKSTPLRLHAILLVLLIILAACTRFQGEPEIPTASTSPTPSTITVPTPHPIFTTTNIFGIQVDKIVDESGLNQLVGLSNSLWVQTPIFWSAIEPNEGDRNWDALAGKEIELMSVITSGFTPIVTILKTPPWAQKIQGYSCGPMRAEKLDSFARFLHDIVRRYSKEPYNIKFWQIWNEPDIDPTLTTPDSPIGCWGDQSDPYYGGGYYAEMLKIAYPQIKAADPEAQVLLGGLLMDCDPVNPPEISPGSGQYQNCLSTKFVEGTLENGGGEFFDGISFHAYDFYAPDFRYANLNWHSRWDTTGPALTLKAKYLRNLLSRYGLAGKYLMNTEAALLCGSTGSEPICASEEFEVTKAAYLVHSYVAAIEEGLVANLWYSLTGWRGSGLIDQNGVPIRAYLAYSTVSKFLLDAPYIQPLDIPSGIVGAAFTKDEKQLWIVWSQSGEVQRLPLPNTRLALFDMYGNSIPSDPELEIGLTPVYILWDE